jgi:hypothetical protein
VCHICKRKIEQGIVLCCDHCGDLYCESSVPRYHKSYIPISEDGDPFVCHTRFKEENINHSIEKMQQNIDYDSDVSELYLLTTQK